MDPLRSMAAQAFSTGTRGLLRLALGCAALLVANTSLAAPLSITTSGPEEIVFNWRRDQCRPEDFPDSPARAFRASDGSVVLYAAHFYNYFLSGPSLSKVSPRCKSAFMAPMDPVFDHFNARTWLQAFHIGDGDTVYGLGSSDYHGGWFGRCQTPSAQNPECWWSAIVLAVSSDGGKSFNIAAPPHDIIARAPHEYSLDPGRPAGFFAVSNIIGRTGMYYTLVYTFGYKEQPQGACLIRSPNLSSPRSWRAWNGSDFVVTFADPTAPTQDPPQAHACTPVGNFPGPVRSLLWHEATKQYIAIFGAWSRQTDGPGPRVRIDFQFATSPDMVTWSAAKSITSYDSPAGCPKLLDNVAYPSMLDPESKDRNFATVGPDAYIYFTRFNRKDGCSATLDRDLVRIPVHLTASQ
jgi:hypothetical protein